MCGVHEGGLLGRCGGLPVGFVGLTGVASGLGWVGGMMAGVGVAFGWWLLPQGAVLVAGLLPKAPLLDPSAKMTVGTFKYFKPELLSAPQV